MISLDYSIAYQIVLFLVLWIILSKVLFGPYLNLLDERERRTTGAQHDSSDLEQEGARLRAQYEEKIAQAQAAGHAARAAILQDGRPPSIKSGFRSEIFSSLLSSSFVTRFRSSVIFSKRGAKRSSRPSARLPQKNSRRRRWSRITRDGWRAWFKRSSRSKQRCGMRA